MDLRDLWRPGSGVTPRYVLTLAGQFPSDSALGASVRGGPEFRLWSPTVHMLAAVANLLYAANRQRAGKKTKSPLITPPTAKPQVKKLSVADVLNARSSLQESLNR